MKTLNPKPSLLWIAFFSFIAIGLQGSALNVAWLYMQDSFDKTLESVGVVLLAGTLGGLTVSFFSGRILSFLSVGKMCLIATVIEIFALLIISITPHWSVFIGASLLLGLGRSALNVAINTFVAEHYPISRMNWLHAIFGGGATAGPLLVTFIVVNLAADWQLAYSLIAAVQVGVALLFLFTLNDWHLTAEDEKPKLASVSSQALQKTSMKSTLLLVPVWLGISLFACHVGLQVSTGQLLNNLFVEGRSIDAAKAGLWLSLFWAFITLGRLVFGSLVDKFSVARVLRYCMIATVIGAALICFDFSENLSFFGLAVMGFTLAPVFPSSVSRTPKLVGKAHSPNAIGFQMTGAGLGGTFISGGIGFVADNSSLEAIPIALVVIALVQFFIHELLCAQERKDVKQRRLEV